MGKHLDHLNCMMRLSVILAAFSKITWSSMSSTLATSVVEGRSLPTLFSMMASLDVTLPPMGILTPKSWRSSLPNISAMTLSFLSSPHLLSRACSCLWNTVSISDFEIVKPECFWGLTHAFCITLHLCLFESNFFEFFIQTMFLVHVLVPKWILYQSLLPGWKE